MLSKSSNAAIQLLTDYCIDDPNEIPLEDLVISEGGIFEEKPMTGADGRIVFGKKYSVVTINSNIQNKNKRRFVIAHELGHLKLHKNLERFFSCDEKAFLEWHKTGSHESQANEFAAELLMPSKLFASHAAKKTFSLDHIINLSKVFNTSITSTAIRYTDLGSFPIAIIYSQNGEVKWYSRNSNFVCRFLKIKERVPENSVASQFFKKGDVPNSPTLVLPKVWFKDFQLRSDQYFYEQCFKISSLNAVLSFIWPCENF
jgi:Zn-dependent peptidase ImmA (M78 family)